ncbi:MAG: large conductance mechanosensitive channel protein MscL [Kofleriaceae bacterium]
MAMWKDFKAFAFKGNVIDLAVAVVIGAAFTKIVTVLVDALIMPMVGKLLPSGSYAAWAPGGLKFGILLGALIDFFIVAIVLFAVVSAIKRATAKPAEPSAPPEPAPDIKLLTEIRDLLRSRP